MQFVIRRREEERMTAVKCICGSEPEMVEPNMNYSDCWLQCPKCGLRTKNTGGFEYAHEIPVDEARRAAVYSWNNLIADKKMNK